MGVFPMPVPVPVPVPVPMPVWHVCLMGVGGSTPIGRSEVGEDRFVTSFGHGHGHGHVYGGQAPAPVQCSGTSCAAPV